METLDSRYFTATPEEIFLLGAEWLEKQEEIFNNIIKEMRNEE